MGGGGTAAVAGTVRAAAEERLVPDEYPYDPFESADRRFVGLP